MKRSKFVIIIGALILLIVTLIAIDINLPENMSPLQYKDGMMLIYSIHTNQSTLYDVDGNILHTYPAMDGKLTVNIKKDTAYITYTLNKHQKTVTIPLDSDICLPFIYNTNCPPKTYRLKTISIREKGEHGIFLFAKGIEGMRSIIFSEELMIEDTDTKHKYLMDIDYGEKSHVAYEMHGVIPGISDTLNLTEKAIYDEDNQDADKYFADIELILLQTNVPIERKHITLILLPLLVILLIIEAITIIFYGIRFTFNLMKGRK